MHEVERLKKTQRGYVQSPTKNWNLIRDHKFDLVYWWQPCAVLVDSNKGQQNHQTDAEYSSMKWFEEMDLLNQMNMQKFQQEKKVTKKRKQIRGRKKVSYTDEENLFVISHSFTKLAKSHFNIRRRNFFHKKKKKIKRKRLCFWGYSLPVSNPLPVKPTWSTRHIQQILITQKTIELQ